MGSPCRTSWGSPCSLAFPIFDLSRTLDGSQLSFAASQSSSKLTVEKVHQASNRQDAHVKLANESFLFGRDGDIRLVDKGGNRGLSITFLHTVIGVFLVFVHLESLIVQQEHEKLGMEDSAIAIEQVPLPTRAAIYALEEQPQASG